MLFGLKNAPAFQRLNSVLTGLQGVKCLIYLDDIVVYGVRLREHTARLVEIFTKLRQHKLKLQPEKCKFLRKEVIYLRHVIADVIDDGIKPDPTKLKAISEFTIPIKIKEI